MNLKVHYDYESDTLDIGNGLPGSDGQVVADRLTAFFDSDGDVVSVTLENAVEMLAPYFGSNIALQRENVQESVLRYAGDTTSMPTKLEIYYDPESDTLDIGSGKPAAEGYDVADNLTAHVDRGGDVVFVTLEHAAEVLEPYLSEYMNQPDRRLLAGVLRDDGEPS